MRLLSGSKLQKHWKAISAALALSAMVVSLISLNIGFYSLSFADVFNYILSPFSGSENYADVTPTIVKNIRFPRILAALLIGAALAVSGCAYQGMFRNPLVSPDVLGVSSGASVGASLAIVLGFSNLGIQAMAFIFGISVVAICTAISRRSRHNRTLSLVLSGMMLSSLCTAVVTGLKYISDPSDTLPAITFWLMGSLVKVNMDRLLLAFIPMVIGFVTIWIMRYRLNLLVLDDEEAQSMGVNVKRDRLIVIIAATMLSAAAVCLGGLIGWVGLMMPHIARGIVGSDYRRLLPAAALFGGIFLVLMDDLSRTLLVMEIPIGILTAFLGAPFFVALILRRKGGKI